MENKVIYEVRPMIKLGLLYGYKIVKIQNGIIESTGYEYDEDEKYKAESRCELLNELRNKSNQ